MQTKKNFKITSLCLNLSRVAISPAVTATLVKKGFTVNVESGAGLEARFRNDDYAAAGGKLADKKTVFESGKIQLYINKHSDSNSSCSRHCPESSSALGIRSCPV